MADNILAPHYGDYPFTQSFDEIKIDEWVNTSVDRIDTCMSWRSRTIVQTDYMLRIAEIERHNTDDRADLLNLKIALESYANRIAQKLAQPDEKCSG